MIIDTNTEFMNKYFHLWIIYLELLFMIYTYFLILLNLITQNKGIESVHTLVTEIYIQSISDNAKCISTYHMFDYIKLVKTTNVFS